ncbi:MAG: sigma-70 region 4 domain-containing protein [Mesorhizobium sp.]
MVQRVLDELPDERREILVLAEFGELSAPEIAELLEVNLNTVYSRLRLARRDFESGVRRLRARDSWRQK